MKNNFIVIMAGGFGERFWPRSSEKTPKQFLDLNNSGETLIKQTFSRGASKKQLKPFIKSMFWSRNWQRLISILIKNVYKISD